MKTTIDVPDDLYRQVKARAALEGRSVRDVTIALFAAWLAGADTPADDAGEDWLTGWLDVTAPPAP